MELTFIGLVLFVIGTAIVIAGGMRHAMLFLLLTSLLGGSAAIIVTALGGSSIPPTHFALLFVCLRILVPRGGYLGEIPGAFQANRWLALFVFFGIASAFIAPRLFAGAIDIWPMKMTVGTSMFDTIPLEPNSQNITAAMYLLGALLFAMVSWIACRRDGTPATLVSATIGISWLHIAFGLIVLATRGTPADAVFDLLRNSTYEQFNDSVGSFVRIRGIFVETSAYASFGFAFFAANAELWYRSIRPRATGAAALALAALLFFSTSSTAYAGLATYVLFFFLRALAFPGVAGPRKIQMAMVAVGSVIFMAAIVMAIVPGFAQAVFDLVLQMTIGKSASDSGAQRLFWAMQGWDAFVVSSGLGIGPGSFRSSSMAMAVLGSTGIIGSVSFLIYLASVFQPTKTSSWGIAGDPYATLGGAYASAAVIGLIPALLNSPNVHPSATFAIFAGAAMALRPLQSGRVDEPEPEAQLTWR